MSWEYRGHNGPYYTRSRRINGRIVREYLGGGVVGHLQAALDFEEREEQQARQQSERALLASTQEAERELEECCGVIETLTRAVLYASGYHRHKQGEWRRRREKSKEGQEHDGDHYHGRSTSRSNHAVRRRRQDRTAGNAEAAGG